jgi:chromosome segregation ATPase
LSRGDVAPAGYGKGSTVRDSIDVDVLEARRRIAALETERADANETINALLVRAQQLESQLEESETTKTHVERLFLAHLDRELERARAENARLESGI